MTTNKINSDQDFKTALADLSIADQRQIAKRFVDHVLELTDSPRVRQALALAGSDPSGEENVADAYKMAKSAAIESYTLCGNEGDWRRQAGHFVAAAAAACLVPGKQSDTAADLAWNTAMNARMARVCERISDNAAVDNSEAEHQYEVLESFQGQA